MIVNICTGYAYTAIMIAGILGDRHPQLISAENKENIRTCNKKKENINMKVANFFKIMNLLFVQHYKSSYPQKCYSNKKCGRNC